MWHCYEYALELGLHVRVGCSLLCEWLSQLDTLVGSQVNMCSECLQRNNIIRKPFSSNHLVDNGGRVLQNDAAVFRTQETLEHGCKNIDECVASFEDVGIQDRSMVWNTDLVETLELENLLCNAAVTMHSAEARKVMPWWN